MVRPQTKPAYIEKVRFLLLRKIQELKNHKRHKCSTADSNI